MEIEEGIYKQLTFTKGGFENFTNERFDLWEKLLESDKFLIDSNFTVLKNDTGKITGLLLQAIDREYFGFSEDRILLVKLARNGMISGRQVLIEKYRNEEVGDFRTFFYLVDIRKNRKHFELEIRSIIRKDGIDMDALSFIEHGIADLSKPGLDAILSKQVNSFEAVDYIRQRFPELGF